MTLTFERRDSPVTVRLFLSLRRPTHHLRVMLSLPEVIGGVSGVKGSMLLFLIVTMAFGD